MYKYQLRPGYGSDKLLIEFIHGVEKKTFLIDLKKALKQINFEIETTENLWLNDEIIIHVNSSKGKFILSKAIWGFAFILADENQKIISLIDNILSKNDSFIKEEADFSEYKK